MINDQRMWHNVGKQSMTEMVTFKLIQITNYNHLKEQEQPLKKSQAKREEMSRYWIKHLQSLTLELHQQNPPPTPTKINK